MTQSSGRLHVWIALASPDVVYRITVDLDEDI